MTLRILAPAKVNLSLRITGKRGDGYHLLDSLVAFSEFGDIIEMEPGEGCTLKIVGEFASALAPQEDNLVLRAARQLQQISGISQGVHITLHKHIPVGSGLGGGSADAAAALRGLKTF